MSEWTKEEVEILRNAKDIHNNELAKLLPNHTIYACFTKRNRLGISNPLIKYSYNKNYWETPNLMNSMMAGIIGSDGNISKDKRSINNYTFQYKISVKDRCLIDLFRSELQSNNKEEILFQNSPDYPERTFEYRRLRIHGFYNCYLDLLKHYNLFPNKTKRLGPTNLKDIHLNLAYIIGLWIGDGFINIYKTTDGNTFRLGYCSSSELVVRWIESIFNTYFYYIAPPLFGQSDRIAHVSKDKRDNCYKYIVSGTRAAIIFDYLYQMPIYKLPRKFERPEVLAWISIKKKENPHLFIPYGSLKTIDLPKIEDSQNSISQSSILV